MDTDGNDPVAQILVQTDSNTLTETTQTEISPIDSVNSVLRALRDSIEANVDAENGIYVKY